MAHKVTFQWKEVDGRIIRLIQDMTKQGRQLSLLGNPIGGTTSPGLDGVIKVNNENTGDISVTTDILEDIDFEVGSDFDTPEDMIPFAGLLTSLGRINSLAGGQSPEILNFMKVPTWNRTNPLKFNLAPIFHTRSNSILEVLIPILSLTSLTVLRQQSNQTGTEIGGFITPGVYLGNLGKALNSRTQATSSSTSTSLSKASNTATSAAGKASDSNSADPTFNGNSVGFFSIDIPGVTTLKTCLLRSCKPKISKQKTESGGPLWGMLEMQVETILPATSTDLFRPIKNLFEGNQLPSAQSQTNTGRLFT